MVICLLIVVMDNTILNVALRTIQEDLGASQGQMQWAVDSYALVFAGLLIPAGVLGDRLGRRRVLLFGMIAFGVTSALCSFATSSGTLILFRALMGIGAAAIQPQTLSIIQNVFEPRERAKAIGIWAGASGAAIALGPIAGGLLLKWFWWGSVFLINVPFVVVGAVAIWLLVPDSRDPKPGRLDPAGALLSVVALVVLVYGVIEGGNSNEWLRWNTLGAIILGVVLLALFVWDQHRSDHPTIDVSLFRNRHFSAGVGAISGTFFALMGSTFYLAYFMQAVRDYTALSAGVALLASAIPVMIVAPLSARLSHRIGPRVTAGIGMLLFAISMMSYGLATQTMPQWVIEVQLAIMGVGMGLVMQPATTSIMSAVPREKAGAGSAVNNTVLQVAAALGVAILGSVLAVAFRSHLGADASQQVAAKLDQPAAVVQQLPDSAKVSSVMTKDDTQSIGNALEFLGKVWDPKTDSGVLATRQQLLKGRVSDEQAAAAQQNAKAVLTDFQSRAKSSFMTGMRITSLFSGLVCLLAAIVAFCFFPSRREFLEHAAGPAAAAPPEPVAAH